MEDFDDLDDALWALLQFLDPEETGAISGEPWMSPDFDSLVERLFRALSRTSSAESGVEDLLVRSALLDRVTGLVSEMASSRGELMGRLNSLSRLIKVPYAQRAASIPGMPSALSKRI